MAPALTTTATVHPAASQRGAVLFVALVLLLVLTMLALGAMRGNIFQEKMAQNAQEGHRALRAAESVLDALLADTDSPAFVLTNTMDRPFTKTLASSDLSDYGAYLQSLNYQAFFRQASTPRRGSGWDATYAFYHFATISEAVTKSRATAEIHIGMYQVGKK